MPMYMHFLAVEEVVGWARWEYRMDGSCSLATHTSLAVHTVSRARTANHFRFGDAFQQIKVAMYISLADIYKRDL